jgi:hypothetical protein
MSAPHPSVYILEEMAARGWSSIELAQAMPGDFQTNHAAVHIYLILGPKKPNMRIGDATDYAAAFGVLPELFLNLERAWLRGIAN